MNGNADLTMNANVLLTALRVPTRRFFRSMVQGMTPVVPSVSKQPGLVSTKDFFAQMLSQNRSINPSRQPSRSSRETLESAMRSFQWE